MEVGTCSTSLGSGMAASAALLQQLDIENLQLLSNELLCPPEPHGTILASSLTMSSSLLRCLSSQSCSLTRLIYKNEDKLKRELAVAIARAANQGEDYLIELTNQICLCLQVKKYYSIAYWQKMKLVAWWPMCTALHIYWVCHVCIICLSIMSILLDLPHH